MSSRPAKRRKQEKQEAACFLDIFPKEVFDNLLRWFSDLPNAKNWETHIEVGDLMSLFAVHGELGSFIKSRFKTLCISETKYCETCVGWKVRDEPHLWTDNMDTAIAYVLSGGGESLTTLVVSPDYYGTELAERKYRYDGGKKYFELLKHCPNLTSLSFKESGAHFSKIIGSSWASRFEKQLEVLELGTCWPMELPLPSTTLRELTFHTHSDDISAPNLWKRIGGGLEKLEVSGPICAENGFDKFRQHCPNLKSISLEGEEPKNAAKVASLLASYGAELEYALLSDMNTRSLKRLAKSCPNARFDLDASGARLTIAGLEALGPRLESVQMCELKIKDNVDAWKNAWNKCVNLRALSTIHLLMEEAEIMFATPKVHLKHLHLNLREDTKDVKKLMDVCARGTRCVENLYYKGEVNLYRENSKAFFEQNRASLSTITVGGMYRAGKKLDQFFDSLLGLPALEKLELYCKIREDKAQALKKRGIYYKRDINDPR